MIHFSNIKKKNIPKIYPELEIRICCFGGKFKFKFRIVFWNILILEIGRFEKRIALSEKKPTLGEGELISQISTFLRRPQKFAQKDYSNVCGLLKKAEF